jgi:uncharacterized protein YcgI (DUF1989 family)
MAATVKAFLAKVGETRIWTVKNETKVRASDCICTACSSCR